VGIAGLAEARVGGALSCVDEIVVDVSSGSRDDMHDAQQIVGIAAHAVYADDFGQLAHDFHELLDPHVIASIRPDFDQDHQDRKVEPHAFFD
jgi:hypothetical protein